MTLRAAFRIGATISLVLSACSPVSPTPGDAAVRLAASSSGVCQAIVALPDVAAAERTFTNVAHEALHSLAAEPRLDRQLSARVLEAMQNVEVDFGQTQPPDVAVLTAHLTKLHEAADRALVSIGETAPPCAR
jgi:hypothetical protein